MFVLVSNTTLPLRVSGFPFSVYVSWNVMEPTAVPAGRSLFIVVGTPAGKISASEDDGVPDGVQLFGSDQLPLTAPVQERVTPKTGSDKHTTSAKPAVKRDIRKSSRPDESTGPDGRPAE